MKREKDYLDDLQEWQDHQFNPGYYVGNGKIPPYVKDVGNPRLAAWVWLIQGILGLILGVLFVAAVLTHFLYCDYPIVACILVLILCFGVAVLSFLMYIALSKRAEEQKKRGAGV